ncbi:DUF4283 domain-containing protein, partial [Cephalotus follicularis]
EEGMDQLWEHLKLTDEEEKDISVDDSMIDNNDPKGFYCLIGSLWKLKYFNKEVLKNRMQSLWRTQYGLKIREVGNNLFLFMFNNDEDRWRVLKSRPWHFDKHILLPEKLSKETRPSPVSLHRASFWVRVFAVPYLCLSVRVGKVIGEAIGELEEVEIHKGRKKSKQFIKLRIGIDVRIPLHRGMKLLVGSS